MDRNYDIDSILAEIKAKKSGGDAPRRPIQSREGQEGVTYNGPPRRAVEYEDGYEEERPPRRPAQRRAVEYEDGYEEERPPRKLTLRRRTKDEEDEFLMKYSGLSSIGTGAHRLDRDSIRGNFGSVAPQAAGGRRPKKEEAPKQAEERGGFHFRAGQSGDGPEPGGSVTRLNLPIAGISSHEEQADFDNTRSMPGLAFTETNSISSRFQDPDEPLEDANACHPQMDEFTNPTEAPSVRSDLSTMRSSLMTRLVGSVACTLGLLYLAFLPQPKAISLEAAPVMHMLLSLVLLMGAAMFCHSTLTHGIAGLFTLRANTDSLPAMAVLASVIQGTALALYPAGFAEKGVGIYFLVVSLGLVCSTIGKIFTLGRIAGNFRFLTTGEQKFGVRLLGRRELAREFTWDMNIDEPHIAYSGKTGFFQSFVAQSYADDASENIARITVPILVVGSILVAAISYVFNKSLLLALTTFAAVLAIASPFTGAIVGSLPLHKAYRKLFPKGALLAGYNAVERFAETNVILADACELFTSDEVLLHNIKTFEKNRIDEAILDASSVLCMCNGAVKNIFLRIIQGNTKMLKPVENLVYEDGMGISAWVGGKRVLIGNSDLMRHHGIDTPSRDYESKYRTEERDILYLANSGELTAMFVISYVRNEDVADALHHLEQKGISIVVKSVDPNLTASKIARIYDLPDEMVRILPAKLHPDFDQLHEPQTVEICYLAHDGRFEGFACAVAAASSVKVATNIGMIVQIVGMVLGYTLVTFFSLMGGIAQASLLTVLAYQLVWSVAVCLFSGLRRI